MLPMVQIKCVLCLNLPKCTMEIIQWHMASKTQNRIFPEQEKSSLEKALWHAGCRFTQTGTQKSSSPELFVLKAKCILASLHLHGVAVADIILLRWTITSHYILILFPTRITSHFFSLVSLVCGSSITITFWQMTAKYMFDLTECDSSIDNNQNKVLL